MPLLLTPAAPLKTPALLPVASLYVIIDSLTFDRKLRTASFTLGYYASEVASLPNAAAPVEVSLPTGFTLPMTPAQAGAVGDPQTMLEDYAKQQLLALLPDAVITTVA